MDPIFEFTGKIWLWSSEKAAWHFISVPKDLSAEIKSFDGPRRGFGSMRVKVTIGSSEWMTSVFPSSKEQVYILPIKASVRKKEKIGEGDKVKVRIALQI